VIEFEGISLSNNSIITRKRKRKRKREREAIERIKAEYNKRKSSDLPISATKLD